MGLLDKALNFIPKTLDSALDFTSDSLVKALNYGKSKASRMLRPRQKVYSDFGGDEALNETYAGFGGDLALAANVTPEQIKEATPVGRLAQAGALAGMAFPSKGIGMISEGLPGARIIPQAFKGFKDLTTKFLDYIKGKTYLSRQEIADFARRPELKKGEADLIMRKLAEFNERYGVAPAGPTVSSSAQPEYLYHVTLTDNVNNIKEKGLNIFHSKGSNWVQAGDKTRYGEGNVYAFENLEDAVKWAANMDWAFNKEMGGGKTSIVRIRKDGRWMPDPSEDPNIQMGKGKSLMSPFVESKNVDTAIPVTKDIVKKINSGEISPESLFPESTLRGTADFKLPKEMKALYDEAALYKDFKSFNEYINGRLEKVPPKILKGLDSPVFRDVFGKDIGTFWRYVKKGELPEDIVNPLVQPEFLRTSSLAQEATTDGKISAQEFADALYKDLIKFRPQRLGLPDFPRVTIGNTVESKIVQDKIPALEQEAQRLQYMGDKAGADKVWKQVQELTEQAEEMSLAGGKGYEEVIYNAPFETGGSSHYPNAPKYAVHVRGNEYDYGNTRAWRDQEIQSDVLQKGNIDRELDRLFDEYGVAGDHYDDVIKNYDKWIITAKSKLKNGTFADYDNTPEQLVKDKNDFIKRYNDLSKKRDALTPFVNDRFGERILKERIREKAKKGYDEYWFPTGETIGKIEGFTDDNWYDAAESSIHGVFESTRPLGINDLSIGKVVNQLEAGPYGESWVVSEVLDDGRFKATKLSDVQQVMGRGGYSVKEIKPGFYMLQDKMGRQIASHTNKKFLIEEGEKFYTRQNVPQTNEEAIKFMREAGTLYEEVFDLTGNSNPQYERYEKWGKFLKNKYDGKLVKDDNDVSWIRVKLKPEYKTKPIEAFGIGALLGIPASEDEQSRRNTDAAWNAAMKQGEDRRWRKENIPENYGDMSPRLVVNEKLYKTSEPVDVNDVKTLTKLYQVTPEMRAKYGGPIKSLGNIDLETHRYATNPDHVRGIQNIYNEVHTENGTDKPIKDYNYKEMQREFERLDSPLQYISGQIADALIYYGITPGEFIAVVRQDSGAGTSGSRAIDNKNPGNVQNTDDGTNTKFNTWIEGCVAAIRNLNSRRVDLFTSPFNK